MHILEQKVASLQMVLGKLYIHTQKPETRSLSPTLYKYQSKCTNDLNATPETLKLPEENIEETLQDLSISNDFQNRNSIVQEMIPKLTNRITSN
jgi:hypothetical protein